MHRLRALLSGLVFAGTGLVAQQPAPANGPVTVRGAYHLHFRMKLATVLPNGATITCKARIAPQAGDLSKGTVAAPVETATGIATVNGTLANCAVEIPFAWTVANARAGVAVSYQISAVADAGRGPQEVRTSAREQLALAYPPESGMANLNVDMTF